MKQQKLVNAYKTLKKYENEKLPLDISYAFFKLKKLLQEQWDFEIEREEALYNKYSPEQKNENLEFKSPEDKDNFVKELNDLLDMEVDWDEDKVKVKFDGRLDMPMVDIEALDDFLTF